MFKRLIASWLRRTSALTVEKDFIPLEKAKDAPQGFFRETSRGFEALGFSTLTQFSLKSKRKNFAVYLISPDRTATVELSWLQFDAKRAIFGISIESFFVDGSYLWSNANEDGSRTINFLVLNAPPPKHPPERSRRLPDNCSWSELWDEHSKEAKKFSFAESVPLRQFENLDQFLKCKAEVDEHTRFIV